MLEGGNEVKIVVAGFLSVVVAGLMMVPCGVSAGMKTLTVQDLRGDLGPKFDYDTLEVVVTWPDDRPLVEVGYFDMLSYSFSYSTKEKGYTFCMEVSKALPAEGTPLPMGYRMAQWLVWLDVEPWHIKYNPYAETYFSVVLTYDGTAYVAELRDGPRLGPVLATLPFSVDGANVEMKFTADSIGNLDSFWILPGTVVQWGTPGSAGYWVLDSSDADAAPGQVWWDIPWPQ